MPRKDVRDQEQFETFYFAVDDWFRDYRFGINRIKWEFSPGHYDEHDSITVRGTLRSTTRRKLNRGEMHLFPTDTPLREWSDDLDKIGNVWTKDGKLCWSTWIPAEIFYSLVPVLAAGKIKEISVTVRNLRYRKGATDSFHLHHELTELDEDE